MIAPLLGPVRREWTLQALAEAMGLPPPRGGARIDGVQEDSRRCRAGDLFVAVRGTREDGGAYVADALARGAAAVASESDPGPGVAWLPVPCAREAAGPLADLVYGDPSRALVLVGVTGTNGKTTVTQLLAQLLPGPVGTIGTLGVAFPGRAWETDNTTPGPTELRRILRAMVEAGCRVCAMEVSSHALDQRRVDGLRFRAAVYTNLTGDHLDYHGSMAAYAAAKARIFDLLGPDAVAVVNGRDPACARPVTRARVVRFQPSDVVVRPEGTRFTWRGRTVVTPLIGGHNAENAAAALEAACALGVAPDAAVRALRRARGARGRLEAVQTRPFLVLVDYAHTDDALEKALRAVRELEPARLLVVFGCGGDRDRTKRPRMGAVAAELADVVIVTSDNPRGEEPGAIAEAIVGGMGGRPVEVILDRRAAIARALALARPSDAVLIAGKGHETVQIVKGTKHPFDDAAVARELLGAAARELAAGPKS